MTRSRQVAFGGSAVTLTYDGPETAAILDFLFDQITPLDGLEPHIIYHLETVDDALRLSDEKTTLIQGSPALVADSLLGQVCHQLADKSQGGLLFHAAGLSRQGKGIILPGTMGAGKTTLTAYLLTEGLDYLTDELVFITNETMIVKGFARPLNLKLPSRPVLKSRVDYVAQPEAIFSTVGIDLVPPHLFNPATTVSQPPSALILFPHYQAGSQFLLQPLSKAQAGLALMECLVNARNLEDHGFAAVSRLARAVPAYKLYYSHFDQLEGLLDKLGL